MSKRLKNKRKKTERQVLSKGLTSRQRVVYGKDSFDRFDHKLTEEILRYLTFSDKVKLECVSKQWKRCIFQRQFVLKVSDYYRNEQNSLNEIIVKKRSEVPISFYQSDNSDESDDLLQDEWEQTLDLPQKRIEKSAYESVLKKCPNI